MERKKLKSLYSIVRVCIWLSVLKAKSKVKLVLSVYNKRLLCLLLDLENLPIAILSGRRVNNQVA